MALFGGEPRRPAPALAGARDTSRMSRLPLQNRAGRRAVVARALCLLAVVVQTVLLYMPASGEGGLPRGVDKIAHACMFGGVAALALWGRWAWVPLVLVAYAPFSELIQGLPAVGRDPDWHDVLADVTGVIIATVLSHLALRRRIS